jgi:hypothetical protein
MSSKTIDNNVPPSLPGRAAPTAIVPAQVQEQVIRALQAVRFGSVEIIIHDGKVVQIERREKVRLGEG